MRLMHICITKLVEHKMKMKIMYVCGLSAGKNKKRNRKREIKRNKKKNLNHIYIQEFNRLSMTFASFKLVETLSVINYTQLVKNSFFFFFIYVAFNLYSINNLLLFLY